MKKIDFKKLGVLVALIVVAVLAIFGITKIVQKISGPSKAVREQVEGNIENYFAYLSIGHSSIFNGMDLLFDKDKVTFDDLNKGSIIEVALNYAADKGKDLTVPKTAVDTFNKANKKSGVGFNAKVVSETIKELFDKEVPMTDYAADANYLYDYYYIDDFDILIKSKSKTKDIGTDNNFVTTSVIETKKEKGNLVTTVAVAYVYSNGSTYSFAADKNGVKIVDGARETAEFPKDKIDEFPKYKFISKKVDDRYVFDSIEKVVEEK